MICTSFERIHRSNLVGMGVLPLCFKEGESADSLGLAGDEFFTVVGLDDTIEPLQDMEIVATGSDGRELRFTTTVRLDTPVEGEYYRNGGILQTVIRNMVRSG